MIIGLSGYARSGKDESAKALVGFGFQRAAFADKLREFLLRLNPIVGLESDVSAVRVSDVVEEYGWDGYKTSPYGTEMRELMQRLGTECGRQLISDSIWVDAALGDYDRTKRLVIPDVRFPNEYAAIVKRGGYVIRINRPGIDPANAHVSETALDDHGFHAIVENDGTVDELHARVLNALVGLVLGNSL